MKNIETAQKALDQTSFTLELEQIPRKQTSSLESLLIKYGFKPATLIYYNKSWCVFVFKLKTDPNQAAYVGLKYDEQLETYVANTKFPMQLCREIHAAKLLEKSFGSPEVLTLANSFEMHGDVLKMPTFTTF